MIRRVRVWLVFIVLVTIMGAWLRSTGQTNIFSRGIRELDGGALDEILTSLSPAGGRISGIAISLLMSLVSGALGLVIVLQRNRIIRLEQDLQRSNSQRLQELNQLMVGLAHEVRNPLNSIRLNLYTADRVFRGDAQLDAEEITAMLGESVREIERVDSLMNLLLGYARADDLEITTVDLCREIRSVADFLQPALQASGITLDLSLPDRQECLTRAGRGHVRQVLLNLLSNSKEAAVETGGKIMIQLKQHRERIEVTVTDNGNGILEEHRHRLFAPFFSTKEQGPGLGLAIVRSLMERTGGHVECLRTDHGHCQFRVSWPALRDEPSERPVL